MLKIKNPILWENDKFIIRTPSNPHLPYSEGLHIYIAPKKEIANAWEDPELAAETFKYSSEACRLIEGLGLAPWFNIQANGNWGLLEGNSPYFHIHAYGRNMTKNWGKPLILPESPDSYKNESMPEHDLNLIKNAFKHL